MANIEKYTLKNGKTRYKFKLYLGVDELTGAEKRSTFRFDTYKEAKEALAKIQYERSKGNLLINTNSDTSLTLNEIYDKWLPIYEGTVQESTYDKTVRLFENHILPKLGKYKVDKITVDHCQNAFNSWRKTLKRFRMIKNYASMLLDFAQMRGYIKNNPMKLVLMPQTRLTKSLSLSEEENFFTKEEFNHFINALEGLLNDKRRTYLYLVAYTGMRKSEALALQWSDIDFKNYTISITKAVKQGKKTGLTLGPTKNYTERTISISQNLIEILKNWQLEQQEQLKFLNCTYKGSKQLVFHNNKNHLVNPNQPTRWLTDFLAANSLRKISNHGLRHTHSTLLFEAGIDPKSIQQRLGHTDIQTTLNTYTHFSQKNLNSVPDRLDDFLK